MVRKGLERTWRKRMEERFYYVKNGLSVSASEPTVVIPLPIYKPSSALSGFNSLWKRGEKEKRKEQNRKEAIYTRYIYRASVLVYVINTVTATMFCPPSPSRDDILSRSDQRIYSG